MPNYKSSSAVLMIVEMLLLMEIQEQMKKDTCVV